MITLAAERQVVRLGAGVFRDGRLSEQSMENACAALETMVGKYRKLDLLAVRAVGTAALRDAGNQPEFLARASTTLGNSGRNYFRSGRSAASAPGRAVACGRIPSNAS